MKVLHVENSITIAAGVRGICRRLPHIALVQVARIEDAKRAIYQARERPFDLAILDVSLPDGSARDLLPLLRSTRIVFLTAHNPGTLAWHKVLKKTPGWDLSLEEILRHG